MNRRDILKGCPEEFVEDLVEILDHIEGRVNDIESKLSINNLNDLADITEASELVSQLASDLY